jgi:hypothetical protein
LDFSDMIPMAIDLFQRRGDIRARYQQQLPCCAQEAFPPSDKDMGGSVRPEISCSDYLLLLLVFFSLP